MGSIWVRFWDRFGSVWVWFGAELYFYIYIYIYSAEPVGPGGGEATHGYSVLDISWDLRRAHEVVFSFFAVTFGRYNLGEWGAV